MKINTFKRHFREGTKNLVRNSWMTVAAVGAVTTTLVLVAAFLMLMLNLNQIADNIESDADIRVFIDLSAEEDDIDELGQNIGELNRVEEFYFSSKDEELEALVEDLGEDGEAWELFEQDNPLNDVYVVETYEAEDLAGVASTIEGFSNVDDVDYGSETVDRLLQFNQYARYIGITFIAALLLTAIFLISNTIKMTITARRDEIGIMRLVGAKNSFIRWPFFVEGMLTGVIGSVIPIALVLGGYHFLYINLNDRLNFQFIELLPWNPFAWQLSLMLLAIGAFIGIWGSVMSVRKFLKV
ncbi:permease-like cell division protein FtsX [Alkalibacillus haloalkaliphilus]|uniref:Cell division protein FtsX n=1 Tax=Alkalibacillus haloalkaliphilus TaxID=94136 RepID=A0A511W7W9_9BACI|nr:permease-like cell division protein FtsX [Alkalibacillus haloalkaliphilus]GEN47180.1 cell division protein FtsX [Alkalibacillus haloalkaliphilus]